MAHVLIATVNCFRKLLQHVLPVKKKKSIFFFPRFLFDFDIGVLSGNSRFSTLHLLLLFKADIFVFILLFWLLVVWCERLVCGRLVLRFYFAMQKSRLGKCNYCCCDTTSSCNALFVFLMCASYYLLLWHIFSIASTCLHSFALHPVA